MDHSGYNDEIHRGFIFCLLSSKRPFHEILKPSLLDQRMVLKSQFSGMTDELYTYDMFETTREQLIETIRDSFSFEDKILLMTFAEGNPKWPGEDFSSYPGVQWKLFNINKLKSGNNTKHKVQLKQLETVLFS